MSNDLYTDAFERWWKAYPRRVSKLPSAKAWAKLDENEQLRAQQDVEKRTRFKWWSSDPRKIPHAATYLNAARFDDEWESDLKYREEAEPTFDPRPTTQLDAGVERDRWGMIGQKIAFKWLLESSGVEDIKPLVRIKNETVDELRPSLAEEEDQDAAAYTLADTLLLRFDMEYGRAMRSTIMNSIR